MTPLLSSFWDVRSCKLLVCRIEVLCLFASGLLHLLLWVKGLLHPQLQPQAHMPYLQPVLHPCCASCCPACFLECRCCLACATCWRWSSCGGRLQRTACAYCAHAQCTVRRQPWQYSGAAADTRLGLRCHCFSVPLFRSLSISVCMSTSLSPPLSSPLSSSPPPLPAYFLSFSLQVDGPVS